MSKRIFSGIQPSGNLHLGNYLGALKHWVRAQDDENENIFCIVDLHAITVPREPKVLRANTKELAALFFAAGLDPKKSTVFIQSHVPAHAELAWMLTCVTPMGWMKRMTQFKEKSAKKRDQVSVGLFAYPDLMAADILLYQTDLVPVGEDQKQHVELTRDIAQSFNSQYGQTFKLPEPVIPKAGARIMGLDDPAKKMAKTDDKPNRAVFLLDPPDVIRAKFRRATTDSLKEIRFDQKRPGINNLLTIYQMFSEENLKAIEERFAGRQYSEFKSELADLVVEKLRPIQERYKELQKDKTHLESLLKQGADKVAPIAERTLSKVRRRLGLFSL